MRRTWNGTCVDDVMTSRSSLSHAEIAICGSIGVCCTWCTRIVCSNTRSAAAKPSCDVAGLGFDVVDEVVGRVVRPLHVRFVVDDRRSIEDRLVLVEHCGEHFVGDVDQVDCGEGNLLGVGGNGGNAVPDEADAVVEADLVVGERVRVALSARRVPNAGHIAVMDDGMHTGERESVPSRRWRRSWRWRAGCRGLWRSGCRTGSTSSVNAGLPLTSLMASTLVSAFPTMRVSGTSSLGTTRGAMAGKICLGCFRAARAGERVKEYHVDTLRCLTAHHGCGAQHRVHRTEIAGLAVQNPGEGVSDVVLGWIRVSSDQRLRSEDHRRVSSTPTESRRSR